MKWPRLKLGKGEGMHDELYRENIRQRIEPVIVNGAIVLLVGALFASAVWAWLELVSR